MTPLPVPTYQDDPRWRAFCSPQGPDVFHAVVSTNQVYKADPFDVESIHAEARDVFAGTVARINGAGPGRTGLEDDQGKMLLLRGESGAGKTHLLRAYRHYLHSRGLGWLVYVQMTTGIGSYALYVLRETVKSLSEPYDLDGGAEESGWRRLSNYLAEHPSVPAELRADLREGEAVDPGNCYKLVFKIADCLLDDPHFERADLHADVVRAVLFFQRPEPAYARRALMFLRGDPLTAADRDYLGGLAPRTAEEDPLEMLVQIGRLTNCFERQALVLCLDQLEEIWNYNADAAQRFLSAMGAMRALTDKHPGALVVISCLDGLYARLRELIATDQQSLLDRLERAAPAPILLRTDRRREEVEAMVGKRLEALYQHLDVEFRPEEPLFPFAPEEVAKLANLRPRAVLLECHRARLHSLRTGERPVIGSPPVPGGQGGGAAPPAPAFPVLDLEQLWNDFHNAHSQPPPEKEAELAALLAWAVEAVNPEQGLPEDGQGFAARANHTLVEIDLPEMPDAPRRALAGVCNAGAPGGKLSRQVAELTAAAAGGRAAVAVRSTVFPGKQPNSQIGKQFAEMIKAGGRRAVMEDAEWRTIQALQRFLPRQPDPRVAAAWRAAEQPLSRLPGLRALLLLDKLPARERAPVIVPDPRPGKEEGSPAPGGIVVPDGGAAAVEPPVAPVRETGPVTLGQTREAAPRSVTLEAKELTRHAAFLGGSGSGKTTLALAMIEGLLLRGIPAILIDRKGDLASYARPASWTAALPPELGPDAPVRRAQLRAQTDVRLYTPGEAGGRPLGISLLPPGTGALPGPEREAAARAAAASLGNLMGYRTAAAQPKVALLGRAIETLAGLEPEAEMTLPRLMDFIASEDDGLLNAIGHLDPKLFKKLLLGLAGFAGVQGHLLAAAGERVQAERLFGLAGSGDPAPPGRTRLSIVNTQGLGSGDNALFWLAQFLLEMGRFAAKRPSAGLQGVVLFDEADLYLPAVGKPVTKEPMENALRRWRSAGLGVLLSSQSPGDFDYKCRDNVRNWLVGKVQEDTALKKMKPMLREAKTDIAAKLPGLQMGQFFVVREGKVESLAAARSLVLAEQLPDGEILRLARQGMTNDE